MILDKRLENRSLSLGRFTSKKRVKSSLSTLSPPPLVIEWAVKSSCRPSSSQDKQVPRQSPEIVNTSTERMSHNASCQQTPLSHHLHQANRLLEIANDSDDSEWNAEDSCDSFSDL